MTGKPTMPSSAALLNPVLKNELTAINQYFLHSRILRHMGYAKLSDKLYEESIDEMKHADSLTQRILLIGGLPNLQDLGKLLIGETPREMLESDLKLEVNAIDLMRRTVTALEDQEDYVSADLLHSILANEEQHQDWLQRQLLLFDQLGEQNYLQSQV